MLLIGSDDGVYQLRHFETDGEPTAKHVHDSGRVRRVQTFEGVDGVFAATETGLYRSLDGIEWEDLGVPVENVYAVGARAEDGTLFAGTRPAHLFETTVDDDAGWREVNPFRDRPSSEEWQVSRHDDRAQVRDVHVVPGNPERVVAGVEVGGVHVSDDGGATWEAREGGDGDVHELCVLDPETFVVATGFGLFSTENAGRDWRRLDEEFPQRYFRAVSVVGDMVYAAGALRNSSTWNDESADPELFVSEDLRELQPVSHPRPDETVTGMTAVDGTLVAATHRGTVMERDNGWRVVGTFPVPGEVTGRYTPVAHVEL